ncbi:ATP-binding cassette domain-containing protein, partial [Streptococcus salivarius]
MLEIKNFSKSYGDKNVVDNLSISVKPGDIYGFIGANGTGKTTTIKAVVGIHDFEDGSITINGHSIKEEPVICKKMMAYIPDNPDLYEHMTGLQYINFIADLFEIPTKIRR